MSEDTLEAVAAREQTGGWRLSPGWRRLLLFGHVLAGVAWAGVGLALLTLALLGGQANHQAMLALLDTLVLPPPFALGLAASLSGLVLALGTKWGVFRHWWVVAKVVLVGALFNLSQLVLRPTVVTAAEGGAAGGLVAQAALPLVLLTAVVALSMYKPWGRTRRRR